MKQPAITIARYTLLEAIKNQLFVLVIAGAVVISGIGIFVGELSVTETREMQSALMGFVMRLFAVFVVSLFVITSMVREFSDKNIDMIISLDLPRYIYFSGKLTGFFGLGIVVSLLASVPMFFYAEFFQVGLWAISLTCELLIVITLCLLFLFTFGNITIAFTATAAFYILSRCIITIQLISHSPILESADYSQLFIQKIIDLISYLLPHLDQFTKTEWLVYGTGTGDDIAMVITQTFIYVLLLTGAALFDLYRKNF